MDVEIRYLVEGSRGAKGLVIIIDVLRACTTIPILFNQGAKKIIPVSTLEEAAKYENSDYVLVGEGERGHKHDVFHHINSPSEVSNEDFTGKEIIFRSNNATQAILYAKSAKDIILASFVNLNAIVQYVKKNNTSNVTIVASGMLGGRGLEDDLCAEAIKNSLENKPFDFEDMKKRIEKCDCAILVRETLGKPKDVEMSLDLDSYPIVPRVVEEMGTKTIVPIKI